MNLTTKDALAFGLPYAIAVGAAYAMGYWGAVGINVLEFIGIADIAKLAVYPLMATLALGVLAMLGTQLLGQRVLPPGGGVNTPIGRAGRKYWWFLVALVVFASVAIAVFGPEPTRWFVFAILLCTLSTPLGHVPFFQQILPNAYGRSFVLLLLLALPTFSFAQGRLKAFVLKSGSASLYVDVKRSGIAAVADLSNPVAYVGFIGGTYVLRESRTGALIMLRQKDESPLFLSPSE